MRSTTKILATALILIGLTTAPSKASAQPAAGNLRLTLPAPPGSLSAVPIQKGEAAPFNGQLIPPDLAMRLVGNVRSCTSALARVRARCRREQILAAQQASRREAEARQLFDQETVRLQNRLREAADALEANRPPFYARPWFVALATASTMTALMLVSLR